MRYAIMKLLAQSSATSISMPSTLLIVINLFSLLIYYYHARNSTAPIIIIPISLEKKPPESSAFITLMKNTETSPPSIVRLMKLNLSIS